MPDQKESFSQPEKKQVGMVGQTSNPPLLALFLQLARVIKLPAENREIPSLTLATADLLVQNGRGSQE